MIQPITSHPKKISYHAIPGLLQNKNITTERLSIQQIAEAVANAYGIDVETMKLKTRIESIRRPRQIVMYIAIKRANPHYTTSATGRFFNLDHSTCIHATKVIENEMETNRSFHFKIIKILESLKF